MSARACAHGCCVHISNVTERIERNEQRQYHNIDSIVSQQAYIESFVGGNLSNLFKQTNIQLQEF